MSRADIPQPGKFAAGISREKNANDRSPLPAALD
jgi:hypothetical protein